MSFTMNFSTVVAELMPLEPVTVYSTLVEAVSGNVPEMVPVSASIDTPSGRVGVMVKLFRYASERAGMGSVGTVAYWYM